MLLLRCWDRPLILPLLAPTSERLRKWTQESGKRGTQIGLIGMEAGSEAGAQVCGHSLG